jgi:hypothetical protein
MRALNIARKEEAAVQGGKKKLDMLGHIEKIIDLSGKSGLDEAFFANAKAHIRFVMKGLQLNEMQSILFSLFVNRSDDQSIHLHEIAGDIKCNRVKIIQHMNEMDVLEQRKLIRCCREKRSLSYRVPWEVIEALRQGKAYVPANRQNITITELFSVLEDLFEQREADELT